MTSISQYPDLILANGRIYTVDGADSSAEAVAILFGIGSSTVYRWAHRMRDTGSVEPFPTGHPKPLFSNDVLQAVVDAKPDATLAEIVAGCAERTGITVCERTIARRLAALGYTRKKSLFAPTKLTLIA